MKIVGLRVEKYIDSKVSGHNCDFTYKDAEFERHILCGVLSDGRKVEITLSRSEGICGSGWTTASYGNISVKEVARFNGFTHNPLKPINVEDIPIGFDEDIDNHVFTMSSDGGDEYYPGGWYSVNMELFKETVRHKKLRPVWIFKGKSNAGKSFLASKFIELEVYETDVCDKLPNIITASVVVLGNKHKFTLEEIQSKLFGKVEVQIVNFD